MDFKPLDNDTRVLAVAFILNFFVERLNQNLSVKNGVQPLQKIARDFAWESTAECSTWEVMGWRFCGLANKAACIAELLLSVALPVKRISRAEAPIRAAACPRAISSAPLR